MKPAAEGWINSPTRIEPGQDGLEDAEGDLSELIGQQVGNYVIEQPLGRGGMAVVYLARHPALGREVAVKLLSPEYKADLDLNRRFLQEARVTAGLRHPNIVEIYDLGDIGGRAYYTMERLVGTDLASLLTKRGRLPAGEVCDYFAQICGALEVAHREGIVHRDLKPANIFVVDELPLRLKLMDFGIARVSEKRRTNATQRGEVLGTPAYMAPEQALGNVDAISTSTDVYALGIIAYEMLSGRLPFNADSDMLLLTMQIRDLPPPLLEAAPDIPPAMAQLVERCLAKDPHERPRSARELSEGLLRALAEPDAVAAPAPAARPPEAPEAPRLAQPLPPMQPVPAAPRSVARRVTFGAPPPAQVRPPEPLAPSGELEAPAQQDSGVSESSEPAPLAEDAPFEPAQVRPPDTSPRFLSELTDEPATGTPIELTAEDGRVLDRLLRRMQRRADFPSFLNNVTEISRKADADADFSAWQLSEAILKDFALTAKLLRVVNSLFSNRFGGKVFSVKQAVIILGFDSVRSMALGISVYKLGAGRVGPPAGRSRVQDELADEAINSLIAGEVARNLAPKAGIKDTELAMMCAMFRNLGQQLVMEYLPEEYQRIVSLSESQRVTRAAAAGRVLGTTLPKIGLGVAERWNLPRLMRAAMASNPWPNAPLVREEDRLGALAKLSNDLCHVISSGDRHSYKPLLQRLLMSHRRLLVLHDQDISSLLGVVCKSFEARYSALLGPYHRKSRFLFNARALTGSSIPEERSQLPPLTQQDVERMEHAVVSLNAGLQRRQPPDGLLTHAMQVIAAGLAASRALLLTLTADRKELEVRFAIGEDASLLKTHFRVPVTQGGADIFSTALRTGKNVVIEDALGPGAMRRLPQRYFEAIGSAAFALYVCSSRGYPTCLLLIDANTPELLPTRERVKATKALREVLTKIAERR